MKRNDDWKMQKSRSRLVRQCNTKHEIFFKDIVNASKSMLTKNDDSKSKSDHDSIDFEPKTQSEKIEFLNFLLEETLIHDLLMTGKTLE